MNTILAKQIMAIIFFSVMLSISVSPSNEIESYYQIEIKLKYGNPVEWNRIKLHNWY